MPNKPVRIILDTNLWISFLIKKDHSSLTSLLLSGSVILLFSEELLQEFVEVAQRPKFRKYFTTNAVSQLSDLISEFADFVEVDTETTACRDEKDNFLLALAIDGQADYLVTGDADLLELNPFNQVQILTLTNFLKEIST